MKTLKKGLILFLVTIICSLCFSSMACIGKTTDVKGKTYGFYSINISSPNITINAGIGDELEGITLEETYIMIKFNEDETGIMYYSFSGSEEFTWEQDGNTVYCYSDYDPEPEIIKIKSNKIILTEEIENESYTLTLKPTNRKIPNNTQNNSNNSYYASKSNTYFTISSNFILNQTFGFSSMSMEANNMNFSFNVGDRLPDSSVLTEQYLMIYLSSQWENSKYKGKIYFESEGLVEDITFTITNDRIDIYSENEIITFYINNRYGTQLTYSATEYDPDLGAITTTITLTKTNSTIPTIQNSTSTSSNSVSKSSTTTSYYNPY